VTLWLAENRFWLSPGDGDGLLWARGTAIHSGMQVAIEEPDVSPLQLHGPEPPDIASATPSTIRSVKGRGAALLGGSEMGSGSRITPVRLRNRRLALPPLWLDPALDRRRRRLRRCPQDPRMPEAPREIATRRACVVGGDPTQTRGARPDADCDFGQNRPACEDSGLS
jgi:hypothetical protein